MVRMVVATSASMRVKPSDRERKRSSTGKHGARPSPTWSFDHCSNQIEGSRRTGSIRHAEIAHVDWLLVQKNLLGGARQRDLKAGAAERRGADRDPAVVKDDDLLHERQAEAGAVALGGEERPEDPLARFRRDAGAVVFDDDLSLAAVTDRARIERRRPAPAIRRRTPRPHSAAGC